MPLPPCQTINGNCVRRWNNFTLGEDPENGAMAWQRIVRYAGQKIFVEVIIDESRITKIIMRLCGVALDCSDLSISQAGSKTKTTTSNANVGTTGHNTESASAIIYVPQTGGTPTYKPSVIYTSVDSGGVYEIIKWKRYGGDTAVADAHLSVNDCTPDCASGHKTVVTMELTFSERVPCKGVPAYARMSIYKASDPSYDGEYVVLSDFCKEG